MTLTLRAGVAREDISPALGTPLAGYAWWRGSRGVRDPLSATALVADDGSTRIGLVTLDLLAIHPTTAAQIRQQASDAVGIAPERLVLACSHSHSSPVASTSGRAKPAQKAYVEWLIPRVIEALKQAVAKLEPATVHAALGEAHVAVNRRPLGPDGQALLAPNPDGSVDHELAVVQLKSANKQPLGTIVGLACHPTTLSPRHKQASAAWPGVMRQQVEAATGAPCLYLQGGTGDLNPVADWGRKAAELAAMRQIGEAVGQAVIETLEQLQPMVGVPLDARTEQVWLPIEPEAHPRSGRPMTYKQALWRRTHIPPFLTDRLMASFYPWVPTFETRPDGAGVPMEVQALRLGDVALVAHAAESFHGLALAVRDGSPAPFTVFAAYANGMVGYLPTREEHAHGGYEVNVSPYLYRFPGRLAAESGDRVTATSLRLLGSLFT